MWTWMTVQSPFATRCVLTLAGQRLQEMTSVGLSDGSTVKVKAQGTYDGTTGKATFQKSDLDTLAGTGSATLTVAGKAKDQQTGAISTAKLTPGQ